MNIKTDQHYLKKELYELVQNDQRIFTFLHEAALDGIWYRDLEKPENEWMSRRFWEALGYDPEEMSHSPESWQGIIHPDDLTAVVANIERHCDDPDHSYDQVARYRHKDGATVRMRCRGIATRDASGRAIRMLGTHTNISQYAAKPATAFLIDLGHDLRTPLNSLLAMTEALGATQLDADQRSLVHDMKQAGGQLNSLVSGMLDMPRDGQPAPEQEEGWLPFPELKLLIAEDILLNRRSIKQFLTDTDVSFKFAMDGEEALRLLKSEDFDVALIDLRMPRMNGIDLLKEYRAFEAEQSRPRVYAIACSAYITPDESPEYAEAGFDGILEKPFTRAELLKAVTLAHQANETG